MSTSTPTLLSESAVRIFLDTRIPSPIAWRNSVAQYLEMMHRNLLRNGSQIRMVRRKWASISAQLVRTISCGLSPVGATFQPTAKITRARKSSDPTTRNLSCTIPPFCGLGTLRSISNSVVTCNGTQRSHRFLVSSMAESAPWVGITTSATAMLRL